ncbi:MAG TPA: hypothetical protein VHE35_36165 [Kofleriaceae bacterium]|nr:hypothetical protein [Kofleriaceae bacterium]
MDAAGGDAAPPDAAVDAGAGTEGSVTVVGPADCAGGAVRGATCRDVVVHCPGLDDLHAIVGVATPPAAVRGTVVLHAGGGGTSFTFQGANATRYGDDLLQAGFRVVQVAWATDWEQTAGLGILAGSCRPAALFRWAFTDVHQGDRTRGFCALGSSGGSAALSYALAHHGLGDTFDLVQLVAGPPFGRIDVGCAPRTYDGPPRRLCEALTDAPIAFAAGAAREVGTWENTPGECRADAPAPATLARWAADSVVSPGAVYAYPRTAVHFFYCATNPNETTGLGSFYADAITSPHDVTCGTQCSGEGVMADPDVYAAMRTQMTTSCVPHH